MSVAMDLLSNVYRTHLS